MYFGDSFHLAVFNSPIKRREKRLSGVLWHLQHDHPVTSLITIEIIPNSAVQITLLPAMLGQSGVLTPLKKSRNAFIQT